MVMTRVAAKTCPLTGAQKGLLLGWFLYAADDTAERLRGGASTGVGGIVGG